MTENTLWVEKHRPKTLDTYIGNEQLKDKVNGFTALQFAERKGHTEIIRLLANAPPAVADAADARAVLPMAIYKAGVEGDEAAVHSTTRQS